MLKEQSQSKKTPRASLVLGLGLMALVYSIASQGWTSPTIQWTPKELNEIVGQSQTISTTATIISTESLSNVSLYVQRAIRPYVTVSPSSFSTISPGVAQTITITFSIPANASPRELDGDIRLHPTMKRKDGDEDTDEDADTPNWHEYKNNGSHLHVHLQICRCVSESAISLKYPSNPSWHIFSSPLQHGGPIVLNNFANAYLSGGLYPPGGADITITSVALPTSTLPAFIAQETTNSTVLSTTTVTVSGTQGTQVTLTDNYDGGLIQKSVNVYLPIYGRLYKFYLTYNNGDPSEPSFLRAFSQVLASVQISP